MRRYVRASLRVRLPLPLAEEVDALEERGGWGKVYPLDQRFLRKSPHPALPRKGREREPACDAAQQLDLISSSFSLAPRAELRAHSASSPAGLMRRNALRYCSPTALT